jgi:hypothetical protein
MQNTTYFPRVVRGFLMGFDYQSITHSDCHNCDGIGVLCDNHFDRIRPDLEEYSSRRLKLIG